MMVIDTEQEKKEIISRYRKLLRKAKPILNEGDAKLIKRAFTLALEAHKDMRRKSGEPFIFHPLAVAQICVEEVGLGTATGDRRQHRTAGGDVLIARQAPGARVEQAAETIHWVRGFAR
jgi:hypothetical protein